MAARNTGASPVASERRGFSLIELMVVLAVAVVLTGLLMPALGQLRETTNRVVSANNIRQLVLGVTMYADDFSDWLPYTEYLGEFNPPDDTRDVGPKRPQEMMAVHLGEEPENWDGLGLLYAEGYVRTPQTFYCASHRGDHPYEQYEDQWLRQHINPRRIYANYHYCGHIDWREGLRWRLEQGDRLVVVTDGLRTKRDFNHVTGMNIGRGDGSVRWVEDNGRIYERLPDSYDPAAPVPVEEFNSIWRAVEDSNP